MIPQATASSNQAPGLVARGSKPFVQLAFKGHPNLSKELEKSRELHSELAELLTQAGFAGTFCVVAQTTAKGTAHTRGMRIHSPNRHGVVLTWHVKSNDQCIQFAISTPSKMDVMEFHARLKQADSEDDDPEPKSNGVIVDLRPRNDSVPATSPQGPQQTPAPAPAVESTVIPYARFVDDLSNVELFMLEIIKSATPNGWVRRSTCILVLKSGGFGIGTHGTGPVLRSLAVRKHLHEIPTSEENLRISDSWLSKLRPDLQQQSDPPPRAEPAAKPAAPPVKQEERKTAPHMVMQQPPLLGTDVQNGAVKAKLTDVIADLSLKAKAAERWQAELDELEAELASITQSRDVLNQRLARVETKRESLKRNLARPEIVSAREDA